MIYDDLWILQSNAHMQIYHDSFILNHIWFDLKSVRTEWLAELVQVEVLELTGQRLRLGWSRWPTNATATSVHICYIASGWPQEKFPILSMELTLNFTLNLTKLDKLWHWEHLITTLPAGLHLDILGWKTLWPCAERPDSNGQFCLIRCLV